MELWEQRQNRYLAYVATVLREKRPDLDIVEVTYVDENTYQGGYCETCSYTEHELTVCYTDGDGEKHSLEFSTTLQDFLQY